MRPETRRTIHMGVNFIFAPAPNLDQRRFLQFQTRLSEEQVEISQATRTGSQFVLVRQGTPGLQIQVGQPAPPVGQLLIVSGVDATNGAIAAGVTPKVFLDDVEQIVAIVRQVWPEAQQIVSCDSAARLLFDCGGAHAFKYLWEERLGQPEGALHVYERPLQGGGLRLVMPQVEEDPDPSVVEVKMESFLADPSKLYVETMMQWPRSRSIDELDIGALLDQVEHMIDMTVRFVTQA